MTLCMIIDHGHIDGPDCAWCYLCRWLLPNLCLPLMFTYISFRVHTWGFIICTPYFVHIWRHIKYDDCPYTTNPPNYITIHFTSSKTLYARLMETWMNSKSWNTRPEKKTQEGQGSFYMRKLTLVLKGTNFSIFKGYKAICENGKGIKGVLHPWTLFLTTLCILSKNKATLDEVFNGSD